MLSQVQDQDFPEASFKITVKVCAPGKIPHSSKEVYLRRSTCQNNKDLVLNSRRRN